jgi:hypothetical protein
MIWDVYCRPQIPKPGSGFFPPWILDHGSRIQGSKKHWIPDSRSWIQIRNTGFARQTCPTLSTDKLAYRNRQKKKKPLKEQDRAGPEILLYTQYILPPCSLHSRPYCVQVQPSEETSVKSVSLYFLFPPKWATIPVTAEGLLYLTLDRRRDAGGKGRVETKIWYFLFFLFREI